MTDIIKNDCRGEEPDGKESIPVFLARTSKALYGNVESLDADDVCRLAELANRFFTLDCQAASHVESVICMRSAHFTGEPPYTGWKGLGKALREDYDDSDRLRSELEEARERIQAIIDWADFAKALNLANPEMLKIGGVRNLTGPAFDAARAFLNKEKIDKQK